MYDDGYKHASESIIPLTIKIIFCCLGKNIENIYVIHRKNQMFHSEVKRPIFAISFDSDIFNMFI